MVSVIIVNYKNENMTVEFVKNQLSNISQPYRVVIVNNGATVESDKFIADSLDAQIIYDINEPLHKGGAIYVLHNSDNDGFARANNLGSTFSISRLEADYLLFSNNDIEFIDKDVVERLTEKLNSLPDVGIIGPRVVGTDGHLQSPEPYYSFYNRMIYPYLQPLMIWRKKGIKPKYSDVAKEGYHYKVMGSFFLCKARDFIECGMMDSNTFLYYEENILSERMKRIGKYVYYYPCVGVLHAHNQTIGKYATFKKQRDYKFESGAYFYNQYKSISKLYINIAWFLKESSKVIGTFKRYLS